jgi:hypothetical protein
MVMSFFSWFGRAAASRSISGPERPKIPRSFSAVEIVPGENGACKAAQAVAGKRFLPAEAPLFPLQECDQPQCDCTYRRHADRRETARRVTDLGIAVSGKLRPRQDERRRVATPGRRASDQSIAAM